MKFSFLIIFFLFIGSLASAQFSDKLLVNEENVTVARFVVAGDMNNDGLEDVISPSSRKIYVFHNLGDGNFEEGTLVLGDISSSQNIDVADVNGDGFLDVLGTDFGTNDENFWVPNNGDGTYGDKVVISNDVRPYHIFAADIDGDGDQDILTNSSQDSELRLHKNEDGLGAFGPPIVINVGDVNGRLVKAGDIDGDGDLDVVSSGLGGGSALANWFENVDGTGASWTIHGVQSGEGGVESLDLADFDGDGDLDIVKAITLLAIAWNENLDGQGTFGPEQVIDNVSFTASVFAADLDNDGDQDVMATHDDAASWWENIDGDGTFGPQQNFFVGFNFPRGIHATDLDNDTDIDVIVSSQNDNAVYWFKNLTLLGASEYALKGVQVYPNPAKDTLHIAFETEETYTVTVQDVLGRVLLQANDSPSTLNVAPLKPGAMFITLRTNTGILTQKIVKK